MSSKLNSTEILVLSLFTQNISDYSESSNDEEQEFIPRMSEKEMIVSIVISVFYLLSMLGNLRVLCAINEVSYSKIRRPVKLLIGHLSVVAIVFTVLSLVLVAENVNMGNFAGLPGYCNVMGFLRNAVFNLFPLNTVAIIFERMRKFEPTKYGGTGLLTNRLIILIWTVALSANLPSSFMNEYASKSTNTKYGKCHSIKLFGYFGVTVFYEFLRFFIFHMLVVVYMIYALMKIRMKLRNVSILKPTVPSEKARRKTKSIRFIYLHVITFAVFWLPAGFVTFLHRVLNRRPYGPRSPLILISIGVMIYVYLCLVPFINLCLINNSDMNCIFHCSNCCQRDLSMMNQQQGNNEDRIEETKMTTRNPTTTTVTLKMRDQRKTRDEDENEQQVDFV